MKLDPFKEQDFRLSNVRILSSLRALRNWALTQFFLNKHAHITCQSMQHHGGGAGLAPLLTPETKPAMGQRRWVSRWESCSSYQAIHCSRSGDTAVHFMSPLKHTSESFKRQLWGQKFYSCNIPYYCIACFSHFPSDNPVNLRDLWRNTFFVITSLSLDRTFFCRNKLSCKQIALLG